MRARAIALTLLCAQLAGCGGGMAQGAAFDASWSSDEGASVRKLRERLKDAPPPAADAVVGIVGRGRLVGAALPAGKPWTFEHDLTDRPSLVGSALVGLGAGELFALDPRSGKQLWSLKAPGSHLRGAGDDGKTTVVSLVPVVGKGSVVLAIRRDGSVLRQLEDAEEIGVPAVVSRFAFLPWKRQYVSVYDLEEGREVARVLLRTVTSRAFAAGGSFYFGELGATRWDDQTHRAASRQATFVSLPLEGLAGEPPWMRSGTEPVPLAWDAHDKIAVLAQPDGAGVVDGLFASTYYRLVVGSSARGEGVRWVHAGAHDVLAGAQHRGGFALCNDDGSVVLLESEGGEQVGGLGLGQRLEACLVQAEGLTKRARPRVRSLAETLEEGVNLEDARLVAAQRKLLVELARLDEPRATQALIELVRRDGAPPDLAEDARALLEKRRVGLEPMLTALAEGYDFLEGRHQLPPVGPLALALAAANERRAAPSLTRHLLSPATPAPDVAKAAAALAILAGPEERPALERFFALYRGGVPEPELVDALVSVAVALRRLGAADVVARAKADPFTAEVVRRALSAAGGS